MTEKSFEVRDTRIKEKFVLDDKYLNGWARKCGVYASAVYMSLARHADKDQHCWPSLKKIAEEHNISIKQTGRAIKILESHRIIQSERLGKKLNNRYYLLDKSEWTDSPITERTNSPITMDYQSNHIGTNSPIHSKDTHIKETQKEGEAAIAAPTPRQEFLEFLKSPESQIQKLIAARGQIYEPFIRREVESFIGHWTERTASGKKQRWEMEKTFELNRRFATWFRNADKWEKGERPQEVIKF